MAYERYGTRDHPRDERSRWQGEGSARREHSGEDRGFFERAGDEVASWFGDEDAERRRREDQMRQERERGSGRDWGREEYRGGHFGGGRDDRGRFYGAGREWERSPHERDENRSRASRWTGRDIGERGGERDFDRERERGYRPMAGDYGRGSEQFFAASGFGREDFDRGRDWREREPGNRDEFRRTAYAGSADRSREYDPHYHSWRQRHMSDLDRDYDEYRRENQSRFESDFGSWRERRQEKRGMLGQIREHMEVVGSDEQPVGTIERVAGDRIILTRGDDEGGGRHSLSCSDIDRVEGDRVILDRPADEARQRTRDESRSRALFEREDQGEMGPGALDRSFEGTYR
jgi:hypothetical protein